METTNRPEMTPRSRPNNVALAGGAALLVLVFAIGLVPKLRAQDRLKAEAQATTSELPSVILAHGRMASADDLHLPGNVEAFADTVIQARTSGYVKNFYVDIGTHVKTGQLLADIESPDVDQQLAQAQADTAKSVATVTQSQADVARLQAGVSQSQADLAKQRANIKQSQAALDGMKARYESAKSQEASAEAAQAQSEQGVALQKANLAQANAQYDLAKTTERRYRDLLAKGFVAQQDYDQSNSGLKTAAASVEAVKAQIAASQASVRAAEQGVVSAKALVVSAQSDMDAARANVVAARASYTSQEQTVVAARENVKAGISNVVANSAAVKSSAANARRYSVLTGFEHVVAPFDGVITSRNVDVGSLVNPGTALTTSSSATQGAGLFGLARSDMLRIYISVPQSAVEWTKSGTKATVRVRELPKRTFVGTVYQAAGGLNETTRTLLTEIRLTNPNGALLPGMFADVEISPPSQAKSLRVPSNVIVTDSKGTRVVVVDDQNRAHFVPVTLGRDYGTEIEVVTGLKPTDRLVADPTDDVKDGGEVTIVSGDKA